MASRSMRAIREFCDSAVWLYEGRVRSAGLVDETVAAYLAERRGGGAESGE